MFLMQVPESRSGVLDLLPLRLQADPALMLLFVKATTCDALLVRRVISCTTCLLSALLFGMVQVLSSTVTESFCSMAALRVLLLQIRTREHRL